jgi:hypothetical protein
LEVSNATAEAIASLDFLCDEWLGFGNRLAEFVAAADKEETCAMLPVMAANLVLSMNSDEGRGGARRYLARAKSLPPALTHPRAGLARHDRGLDRRRHRPLPEDPRTHGDQWPRDLLAGKLGQLHAFNRGDAEALLRIGERLFAANPDNRYVYAMYAFGLESAIASTRPRRRARRRSRSTAAIPGRITPSPVPGGARQMLEAVAFLTDVRHLGELQLLHVHPQLVASGAFLIDLDRPDEALTCSTSACGAWKEFCEDRSTPSRCWRGSKLRRRCGRPLGRRGAT